MKNGADKRPATPKSNPTRSSSPDQSSASGATHQHAFRRLRDQNPNSRIGWANPFMPRTSSRTATIPAAQTGPTYGRTAAPCIEEQTPGPTGAVSPYGFIDSQWGAWGYHGEEMDQAYLIDRAHGLAMPQRPRHVAGWGTAGATATRVATGGTAFGRARQGVLGALAKPVRETRFACHEGGRHFFARTFYKCHRCSVIIEKTHVFTKKKVAE
jgi:hypothetical protein